MFIEDANDEELFVSLPCHGKKIEDLLGLLTDTILEEKNKIEALMSEKKLSKEERTIAILLKKELASR